MAAHNCLQSQIRGYNAFSVLYWHTRGAQVIHTGKSPIRTNVTTLFYALAFLYIYPRFTG